MNRPGSGCCYRRPGSGAIRCMHRGTAAVGARFDPGPHGRNASARRHSPRRDARALQRIPDAYSLEFIRSAIAYCGTGHAGLVVKRRLRRGTGQRRSELYLAPDSSATGRCKLRPRLLASRPSTLGTDDYCMPVADLANKVAGRFTSAITKPSDVTSIAASLAPVVRAPRRPRPSVGRPAKASRAPEEEH